MAEATRHPPLAGRRFAAPGVGLEPCPPAERLSLRAGPDAVASLSKALGVKLPTQPKTSVTKAGVSALWLGPDEWLLLANHGFGLAGKVAGAADALCSAVDVSHRNTAIAVEGEKAEAVLSSGCPQDLAPAAFPVGACSRTVFGKAEIVLLRTGDAQFRLECWRSFSDYVWKYLVDAAKSA